VEKSQRLNWATPFLTVSAPRMFPSEWRQFPSGSHVAEKNDDSSRLDVVEIAHVA
jgi:hypothetical protein